MMTEQTSTPPRTATLWTWMALGVSLVGLAGSLSLSLGLGLRACPLCFYQRIFIMAAATVLGVGLVAGGIRPGLLSLMALPLALGGLAVAGWHNYLEQVSRLECPQGFLHLGTAPQQSLAIFVMLVFALVADLLKHRWLLGTLGILVLGGMSGYSAILTVPASQAPDYNKPVDDDGICRKPKT